MGPVTTFLVRYLYYPVVAVLLFNLLQRRHKERGRGKRIASLLAGVLLLVFWAVAFLFERFGVPDAYLAIPASGAGVLLYLLRSRFFPFRLRCTVCGKPLPLRTVLFDDANRCDPCSGEVPAP